MGGEWTLCRLGDVCTKIGSGATPRGGSSVYLEQGDVALIRSQNIHNEGFHHDGLVYLSEKHADELANVEVEEGDVLLNITGDSVARACQVHPDVLPARVNQHVAIIRPDPNRLCPLYLRYYLVSPSMQAKMLSLAGAGATRNALTKGMIASLEVPAPEDIVEQRAIAHILGTLDDKIELNRRMSETLEAIARALFKSWFVDFDPVRAKAGGRDPGLPQQLSDLFPDSFEDSELGKIPKGWNTGSLLDQAQLLSGGTPKTDRPEYWNGGVPWTSAKDVSQSGGCFVTSTERTITELGLKQSATQVIPAFSTIVVARGATTGRMTMLGSDMAMNQTCYALRSTLDCNFALYCQARQAMHDLVYRAHGSIFNTITTSTFQTSRFVLAPYNVLRQFENVVDPIFRQVLVKSIQSRTLAAIRDALLPKLLSGEICVRDAEKFMESST